MRSVIGSCAQAIGGGTRAAVGRAYDRFGPDTLETARMITPVDCRIADAPSYESRALTAGTRAGAAGGSP